MSTTTKATATNVATTDQAICVGQTGYLVRTEHLAGHARRATIRYHLEADVPLSTPGGLSREQGWLGGLSDGSGQTNWYAEGPCTVAAVQYQEWTEVDDDGGDVRHVEVASVTVEQVDA